MTRQLNLDARGYERKIHGRADFPVSAGYLNIFSYEGGRFRHHWHREPEFTIVESGEMDYQVNDRIYRLTAGMGIYVNANMLHSGSSEGSDCRYSPVNFDPEYLFGYNNNRIWTQYLHPIISSPLLACIVFDPEKSDRDRRVVELFRQISALVRGREDFYEIGVMALLYEAIRLIAPDALQAATGESDPHALRQVARMKEIIDYVERNFAEPITPTTLAEACNLSYSAFCRSFKALLHQTPTEYINRVRLRKSIALLTDGGHTVTEVAALCGFGSASYFTETFRRYYFSSPTEYLQKLQSTYK